MSARGGVNAGRAALLAAGALLLAAGLFAALRWLGFFAPVYHWNMKYTITVETPRGERRGVSVISETFEDYSDVPLAHMGNIFFFDLKGEAAVADLGGGRYLFALTVREGMKYIVFAAFSARFGRKWGYYRKLAPAIRQFLGKPVELPRREMPLLVTFGDINDPKTVKKVDPDNLAAAFGPGYRLKSITLEITDEPVTRGKVEKVLGWIYDPKLLKNPVWRTLPELVQEVIQGLRQPGGPR